MYIDMLPWHMTLNIIVKVIIIKIRHFSSCTKCNRNAIREMGVSRTAVLESVRILRKVFVI